GQVHDRRPRRGGLGDQGRERLGQVVAVGGHGPVAMGGDGDGQRGVEVGEAARGRKVDALLALHGVPHPVGVGVVAEYGHQAGARGAGRLAGPGEALGAGGDDVEEDGARQQGVQRRVLGGALGGQRVPVGAPGGLGRGRGGGTGGAGSAGDRGRISGHLATPSSIPRMKWRWRNRNRMTVGRATMTAPAASSAVSEVYWPWKLARPSGAVRSRPLGVMTRAIRNSFHVHMNTSTTMVTIAGLLAGTSTRVRAFKGPAPSSAAASSKL